MLFYQFAGFLGYNIGDILNRWAQMGVFAYVLPFLMIFALVYGILSRTQILGENKGVNAVIATSFGLLALQFDFVSGFYASIFPYAGAGLAVLLIALILLGLTHQQGGPNLNVIWLGIGVVIFIFVLLGALSESVWFGGVGYSLAESAPALLAILIILGLMSLVIWGGGRGP